MELKADHGHNTYRAVCPRVLARFCQWHRAFAKFSEKLLVKKHTESNKMSAREEFGTLPDYDSDRAALERAGKKEVLKVCLPP